MNQKTTPNPVSALDAGSQIQKADRGFVKKASVAFLALALTGWVPAWSAGKEGGKEEKVAEFVRTNMDDLESKVRSTLLFGGSSPVSFMGEARLFTQYHNASTFPDYMSRDNNWTAMNWDGNSSMVRIGMIAKAGRSAILWAKLGFQSTFPGFWTNGRNDTQVGSDGIVQNAQYYEAGVNYDEVQGRHDGNNRMLNIHEDMNAGIALRTKPASFWFRMGNVLWTEASPFTIWKSQPRTFAWDYLPFEVEQPIQRYYEYNIAKGEKDGRAAWNKKPFNGINLESIALPGNMYANFVYGTHERYDNYEREYYDWSGDVGYTEFTDGSDSYEAKSQGAGDRWRHIVHGRIAYENPETGFTLGANYVKNLFNEEVFSHAGFRGVFRTLTERVDNDATGESLVTNRAFFKEASTYSVDYFQKFGDWSVKGDLAVNMIDTTWWKGSSFRDAAGEEVAFTEEITNTTSAVHPALYAHVEGNVGLPLKLDIAYISKGFYSPFSFVAPVEGFYAFNSNMVGAGKFIGRGEGSPYVGNMAGINATINPDVGYGHLRLTAGFHTQLEEGVDKLYIPYRLNGSDLYNLFHSSYQRWGNGFVYDGIKNPEGGAMPYYRRMGDESVGPHTAPFNSRDNSFKPLRALGTGSANIGGITSDYLGMYESFVAFPSAAAAEANRLATVENMLEVSATVPRNKKSTWNVEADYAKDISGWFGYSKDILAGVFYAANGVSPGMGFFDMGDDAMLYSHYFRFEPAIAVTNKFYVLGLFGFENWVSNQSYTFIANTASYDHDDFNAEVKALNQQFGTTVVTDGNTYYNAPEAGSANDAAYQAALLQAQTKLEAGVAQLTAFGSSPETYGRVVKTPINYVDMAYGIGFDWDVAPRVGLHYRLKWLTHSDEGMKSAANDIHTTDPDFDVEQNDYDMMIMTGEIKMWF